MIGELLRSEEAGAALVLVLSGALVMLTARGSAPSPGRLSSGVLSNPVPRFLPRGANHDVPLPTPLSGIASRG